MKSALRIALLSLIVGLPAQAHEVETGAIMICDTQKQVERLGQLFDGKPKPTIRQVNIEANDPGACGVADLAYVRGKVLGTVRSKSHTFHVVPVLVVGVNTEEGVRPVEAAVLFTLVEVREHAI
ncbi:MAG: hypothetical protein FJX62_04255 [Alphaproteobacteria bacterium]|nr:hypothetical protein [Alphaproteobacteria bacterium]